MSDIKKEGLRSLPKALRQPFRPHQPWVTGLFGFQEYAEARLKDQELKEERLLILASHYAATDGDGRIDWQKLARHLADNFVPGMRPTYRPPAGAPSKISEHFEVYLKVIETLHNTRLETISSVCEHLARNSPNGSMNAQSLETRFHEVVRFIKSNIGDAPIESDTKGGYPLNFVDDAFHKLGVDVVLALERCRVRYGNLPAGFP